MSTRRSVRFGVATSSSPLVAGAAFVPPSASCVVIEMYAQAIESHALGGSRARCQITNFSYVSRDLTGSAARAVHRCGAPVRGRGFAR